MLIIRSQPGFLVIRLMRAAISVGKKNYDIAMRYGGSRDDRGGVIDDS